MREWTLSGSPIVGLIINVIVQSIVAQTSRHVGRSIVAGALCGLFCTLAIAVRLVRGSALDAFANLLLLVLTYLALAFGFWTFLNLNITSLRIRMLREIADGGANLSREELLRRYSADEFLNRRLERLERGQHLQRSGTCWRLGSGTYLTLARIIGTMRYIILPSKRGE